MRYGGRRLSCGRFGSRAEAEQDIVHLAVAIAQRVLRREIATDPDSKERAAHIRNVAQSLHQGAPATQAERRDQAARIHGAAGEKDKAALYRELEAQIRERDQARAERRAAERPTAERTPAAGGPESGRAAGPGRGGYFENFDNYQGGRRQAESRNRAVAAIALPDGVDPSCESFVRAISDSC